MKYSIDMIGLISPKVKPMMIIKLNIPTKNKVNRKKSYERSIANAFSWHLEQISVSLAMVVAL